MIDIEKTALAVDEAARSATAIPQFSSSMDITVDEAYQVQALSLEQRYKRGERQIGIKMGLTSRAKMVQVGVDEVIWGRLTDAMLVDDGGEIDIANYVHPRAEPEIAFLMKKSLSGLVSPAQALAAVEAIAPAIEIIDSRYQNFKFSLADVVADNSSSSGFVMGPWARPDTDTSNLGVVFEFDGRPVQIGSTAAILGNPARSLAAGSRMLGAQGLSVEAGWIVMAGGVTAAEALRPGVHVSNTVENLGRVGFTVRS
jgi:2-oxo-3-hexenedioate decarboxylase